MKRPIVLMIVAALALALASPALAFAGKGNGKANGKGNGKAASASVDAKGPQHKKAASDAKAAREASKVLRGKAALTADASGTVASAEPTKAVGPGVTNALASITANIEKSLAKIAAGTKKQVPPGLIRVWLKFAAWLGVDVTTMPGAPAPGSAEPTGTIVPTSTVEPTATVVPTATVEPPAVPAL